MTGNQLVVSKVCRSLLRIRFRGAPKIKKIQRMPAAQFLVFARGLALRFVFRFQLSAAPLFLTTSSQ